MNLIPGINGRQIDGFIGVEGNVGGNKYYTEPAFELLSTEDKTIDVGFNIESVEILVSSANPGYRDYNIITLLKDGSFISSLYDIGGIKGDRTTGNVINYSGDENIIRDVIINGSKISFTKVSGDENINISFLVIGKT